MAATTLRGALPDGEHRHPRRPRRRACSRRALLGLATLALLSLAGCAGGAQGTVITQPTGTGPATLQVANMSNEPVYYIHMSPSTQSTWGPDLLGSQILRRGEVFTISNITPGAWDIRVVDQTGNRKEFYNQQFEAGGAYEVIIDAAGWMPPDGQH